MIHWPASLAYLANARTMRGSIFYLREEIWVSQQLAVILSYLNSGIGKVWLPVSHPLLMLRQEAELQIGYEILRSLVTVISHNLFIFIGCWVLY